MNCSIRTKSECWFAPVVIATALMCFQTAQATEPTGSPAAPHAAAISRDRQAEHGPSPKASGPAWRRLGWRDPRVRYDEERLRFRELAASGRWGTGLILGVGF